MFNRIFTLTHKICVFQDSTNKSGGEVVARETAKGYYRTDGYVRFMDFWKAVQFRNGRVNTTHFEFVETQRGQGSMSSVDGCLGV